MKIAILGSTVFGKLFEMCISKYKIEAKNEYILKVFLTDVEFCEYTKYGCEFDMVIINLNGKQVDSINALNHIRDVLNDKETTIVVASSAQNSLPKLIKYRLFYFLKYPFRDKQVNECMNLFESDVGKN